MQTALEVHATSEAKEKDCDYILFSEFEKKKGGSIFGTVVNLASGVAESDLPAGTTSQGRQTRTNVKQTASSGATIGSAINNLDMFKVGDQAILKYRLFKTGGIKATLSGEVKAKLEKEGDNVVSALLLKAANEFLPKIMK